MRWDEIDSQVCSIARTLSIIGDKWTMLILRDCFLGVTRFSDFQKSLGITKHRLSDRLGKLVDAEILKKHIYDESYRRHEYKLTKKGIELYPVLMSLVSWGDKWTADKDGAPLEYIHQPCGHKINAGAACEHCDGAVSAFTVTPILGPGIMKKVKRGELVDFDSQEMYTSIKQKSN
ncbi:transcriptional regulator [Gammaproteobacteria bacterium 45_16_T64]|nr:transcriptional regulator [Gammaproteobacteria bacterium 45_16_T64]